MRFSDVELKSELRKIQQVKCYSRSDTMVAHGYAHAIKTGTQNKPTDVAVLEDKVEALCLLIQDTAKLVSEHAAAITTVATTFM